MRRIRATRLIIAVASGVAVVAVWGAAASAHIEVSADKPQAGAVNVTLSFKGEAESQTAGIKSEQVVLPAGITPQQVRLAKAPAGWTLSPTADGFIMAGTALAPGVDATFSVIIDQLPVSATELAFKTLESYTDGKVSRWIEIPQPGKAEPPHPAPVLKISPAATPVTEPSSAAPVPTTASTTEGPIATPADNGTSTSTADGGSAGWWIAAAALAIGIAGAGWWVRRRRAAA